ncbi:sodium/glutamate symporter, partial [Acinetobacter junii]|uniref:sodium/glutamate symporter n=1 Tax=Acinetobacter junii TaxID=40215 RepID=UPI001F1C4F2E
VMNEQLNATLMSWVQFFNDPLWNFLVVLLVAVGVFYTLITGAQTITMALYAAFVTFRVMGKNYDAAVLAAGHCGFGMGATPT